MWSVCHPISRMPSGPILRLILAHDATVVWSADDWTYTHQADAIPVAALHMWVADLSVEDCPEGRVIQFTFFWKETQRWEGKNYSVAVGRPASGARQPPHALPGPTS